PAGMPGVSPGLVIPVDMHPFHFQPRRLGADWRRFSAIDVERVAREVDVAVLQEHVTAVTFCNLDGERCPHCGRPADPVLLKVLRMAQLSIEYLLHCQERLGTSLATHAQRLQATRAELARGQERAVEQAAQLRGAKEESRRWKKLVVTQQLLLRAGPSACCKVGGGVGGESVSCGGIPPHPSKQNPGRSWQVAPLLMVPVSLSFAERQKMKQQVEQMEDEVEELKAKLREMQQQLELQRDGEKLRREQEAERARQREEERRRDLERWKEEERTKLHEEVDGLRRLFLAAFRDAASRSSAMEGKLQELRAGAVAVSNLGTLRDDGTDEARWQTRSRAEPRERMAAQVSGVGSVFLSLLHSPGGALGWRGTHLHQSAEGAHHVEKHPKYRIRESQNQQPAACSGPGETHVLKEEEEGPTSPLPEHRPHAIVLVSSPTFPPARDEAAALGGKRRLLEALWRNPNLLKRFCPVLEELLEEKLESMGVKRVAKGISTRTYRNLQALLRLQQQQKAEKFPGVLQLRDELGRAVMGKVGRCKKLSSALPRHLSIISGEVTS
ncbi:DZI1L protein, partial [Alopecoenas beccarii]|nr:DZI1L protein [Alopecoenas beccarii]